MISLALTAESEEDAKRARPFGRRKQQPMYATFKCNKDQQHSSVTGRDTHKQWRDRNAMPEGLFIFFCFKQAKEDCEMGREGAPQER